MTQVLLTHAAKEGIRHLLSLKKNLALIIMPHTKTETIIAKFADSDVLASLKTKLIYKTVEGIEIYTFGLNEFPPETILVINFLPIHPHYKTRNLHFETDLPYICSVIVKQAPNMHFPKQAC